jgi:hypothetical protein
LTPQLGDKVKRPNLYDHFVPTTLSELNSRFNDVFAVKRTNPDSGVSIEKATSAVMGLLAKTSTDTPMSVEVQGQIDEMVQSLDPATVERNMAVNLLTTIAALTTVIDGLEDIDDDTLGALVTLGDVIEEKLSDATDVDATDVDATGTDG